MLLLLLSVIGVIQCAAVLHSSEGSRASLVAFPACLCEEDIKLLIVDTLAAKLASLCLDGSEVLFKGVEDLTVADVLLAEDGLVLLSALLVVVLGEVTSEGHGGGRGKDAGVGRRGLGQRGQRGRQVI